MLPPRDTLVHDWLDALKHGRAVLSHSYVLAYYLPASEARYCLEHLQASTGLWPAPCRIASAELPWAARVHALGSACACSGQYVCMLWTVHLHAWTARVHALGSACACSGQRVCMLWAARVHALGAHVHALDSAFACSGQRVCMFFGCLVRGGPEKGMTKGC
eukprot:68275-Chlamydomonas_euryale.AAC.1